MNVFLSHSSKDADVAERLALQHDEHDVFFDRHSLNPSDECNRRIERAPLARYPHRRGERCRERRLASAVDLCETVALATLEDSGCAVLRMANGEHRAVRIEYGTP